MSFGTQFLLHEFTGGVIMHTAHVIQKTCKVVCKLPMFPCWTICGSEEISSPWKKINMNFYKCNMTKTWKIIHPAAQNRNVSPCIPNPPPPGFPPPSSLANFWILAPSKKNSRIAPPNLGASMNDRWESPKIRMPFLAFFKTQKFSAKAWENFAEET